MCVCVFHQNLHVIFVCCIVEIGSPNRKHRRGESFRIYNLTTIVGNSREIEKRHRKTIPRATDTSFKLRIYHFFYLLLFVSFTHLMRIYLLKVFCALLDSFAYRRVIFFLFALHWVLFIVNKICINFSFFFPYFLATEKV